MLFDSNWFSNKNNFLFLFRWFLLSLLGLRQPKQERVSFGISCITDSADDIQLCSWSCRHIPCISDINWWGIFQRNDGNRFVLWLWDLRRFDSELRTDLRWLRFG